MAFGKQGGAEGHARKRMEHDPNHGNRKPLSIFGGDAGVEPMIVGVSLTQAKGLHKRHNASWDRGREGSWESEYEGFEIDGKVWNATYSQWRVIQVPDEQKRPEPSVDTHQEAMSRTTGPRESAKGDNPLGPVESDIDGRAWWEPELG